MKENWTLSTKGRLIHVAALSASGRDRVRDPCFMWHLRRPDKAPRSPRSSAVPLSQTSPQSPHDSSYPPTHTRWRGVAENSLFFAESPCTEDWSEGTISKEKVACREGPVFHRTTWVQLHRTGLICLKRTASAFRLKYLIKWNLQLIKFKSPFHLLLLRCP